MKFSKTTWGDVVRAGMLLALGLGVAFVMVKMGGCVG